MERHELISLGKWIVKERREAAEETGLDPNGTGEFLTGVEEGIAEFIAAITMQAATDILEELTNAP